MSATFTQGRTLLASGKLPWGRAAEPIFALLVADTYAFNSAHRYVSDVLAHEVSGGSYARAAVPGRTVSTSYGSDIVLLKSTGVVFPDLTVVTPAGLIIYRRVGSDDSTPGDDELISYHDFPPAPSTGYSILIRPDDDVFVSLGT